VAATKENFLSGGGEMGARMRALDWSKTPLGTPGSWPQSLRTAVSIVLGSRYPMFLWWGEALVNFYNDAYIPVLGGRHPAALGRPAREIWTEIWDVIGPQADAVLKTGQATWNDRQLLVMQRHGFTEETYFSWSYSPVADESGVVNGVFCACTEDTERVLHERRLRTLRDLGAHTREDSGAQAVCETAARQIERNAHDIPFAAIYLAENGAAEARLAAGVRIDEHREILPPTLALAALAEAQLVERLTRGKRIASTPWPEPVEQALVLPLASAERNEPVGFLIAGISTRRVLDAAYRGFLELVAGHVAKALAGARSYEGEKRRAEALAEVDRAKTAFFSNVSHEFRTPLTLLLGPLAESLADAEQPLPRAQRERQEMVLRSALRLQKLVNTLLDFSRIEAGRAQASYAATDLAGFTASLAATFRSAIEKAGLELVVDCPALPEPAYVDREMWEKIVLNLLSNAFKFTFAGRIALSLRMDGDFVLEVADTGCGIPAAELPRIFERFHRVEGARSRTHEGTGIGLALVHELVRLHRGTVSVESVEGSGSAFRVSIPRGRAHLPAERVGAAPALASTALAPASYVQEALGWLVEPEIQESTVGRGARIVWADDNADMRAYVRSLLAPRYEVEAVGDGEAALAAVRRRAPDLVLADGMMPRLDGLGLARALRADPATRGIPVILLSARAGEEARIEGLDAGADDYLQKPFSARELLARISARLELAAMQRKSEERFRRMADAVPVMIWVSDVSKACTWFNQGWLDFTGRPMQELVGDGWAQDVHPDDLERCLRVYTTRFDAHQPFSMEYRLRRHDGEYRWVLDNGIPQFDVGGAFAGYIGSCIDLTERKRAEEALREADLRKNEFLAMLSHELRNPLAPIHNAVSLLQESGLDAGLAAKALGILGRQVAHITHLVDDLLDITRISRGQISLRKHAVPLAQVVGAALETSRPALEARRHELVVRDAPPSASVLADPVRLAQVISNLLNNAAKYTPPGGRVELEVRTAAGSATIRVRDNGAGIAPEEMPRLFELFRQGEATRRLAPGGLGIGLALARQLAEAHGGTLEGRSDGPGRGAEFTLRIPLTDLDRPAAEKPAAVAGAARRILVVDDNADAADGVAAQLRRSGHEVRIAADGQQALAIANDFQPEVALVDIGLPGMSGYEVAHRLRGTPALLIALTGHGQAQDRARAEAAGFHHHFVKPTDARQIEATIGAWGAS
jgi:PAS domain S-box-containing protein